MESKTFITAEQRQAKQVDELKSLQEKQLKAAEGDESAIKTIGANRDGKYKIAEHDKDYIHIATLTRNLDSDQKKFFDESRVIKIQPNMFDQMLKNSAFASYDDVKVIHDPRPNAPKDYALKPTLPVSQDEAANQIKDAALAAREQKVKDAEKRLDAKMAELEAMLSASGKKPLSGAAAKAAEEKAKKDAEATPATGDLPPLP
jgi:hypothetical protein